MDKLQIIDIKELERFPENPFKVTEDMNFAMLIDSIKDVGVITPITARKAESGAYEVISGHRRWKAAELAGLTEVPVYVKDIDRNKALVLLVDSNIQREDILPSEKALAYKLKLDALKELRKENMPAGDQPGHPLKRLKTVEKLAQLSQDSKTQIQRYIRLTNLIPRLIEYVDQKRIAFTPAVELSYLKENEQAFLCDYIEQNEATPSLSQAVRMRKLSENNELDSDKIQSLMDEVKGNQKEVIKLPLERVRKFFKTDTSYKEIEDTIIKALNYYRKRQRKRDDLSR